MSDHPASPATKEDIRLLMEHLGSLQERVRKEIAEAEERTRRHFDVVAEQMRHDFYGAYNDELVVLDERVSVLEERLGVAD